jgi:hypothetical protein
MAWSFLDLAEPLHPKVLSEFTETLTGRVHSAFIDGHYVYATDDATGALRIISFENPRAPKEGRELGGAGSEHWNAAQGERRERAAGRTLHDVQVKDGLAHLAYWRHGLIILGRGQRHQGRESRIIRSS